MTEFIAVLPFGDSLSVLFWLFLHDDSVVLRAVRPTHRIIARR